MQVEIDTTVIFKLRGRDAVVDVFELDEWVASLWETHGHTNNDDAGNPIIGENGKPTKFLDRNVIIEQFTKWFKDHAKVELKPQEVACMWEHVNASPSLSEKKRASWRSPEAAQPNSPTSPDSTDPRYAD